MPVGEVENVPLSLEDWNEKGGAEMVGVQEASQLDSPVAQVFRYSLS